MDRTSLCICCSACMSVPLGGVRNLGQSSQPVSMITSSIEQSVIPPALLCQYYTLTRCFILHGNNSECLIIMIITCEWEGNGGKESARERTWCPCQCSLVHWATFECHVVRRTVFSLCLLCGVMGFVNIHSFSSMNVRINVNTQCDVV